MSTQTAIRNALTTAINGASLGVPIMFPNQANWTTPSNQQWLRVTYIFGAKDPLSLNDTDQQTLICQVDIFTPKGSGNLSVYQMSDKLDLLFSRKNPIQTVGGIKLNVLSVNTAPVQPDETWHITPFSATIRAYAPKL